MIPDPYSVETTDHVIVRGFRYGALPAPTAVIICHGFNVNQRTPRLITFAHALTEQGRAAYTFDFRGHGTSDGLSSLGDKEVEDLDAVVGFVRARAHDRVVVIGASMGGFVALRHAALRGGVDGVIAISAPAEWVEPELARARVMGRLIATRWGRRLLHAAGTRVDPEIGTPLTPLQVAASIAPIPVTLIHGGRDRYVPPREALRLFEELNEPKKLMLLDRFGHAEAGFDGPFALLVANLVDELLVHSAEGASSGSGSSTGLVGSSTAGLPSPSGVSSSSPG